MLFSPGSPDSIHLFLLFWVHSIYNIELVTVSKLIYYYYYYYYYLTLGASPAQPAQAPRGREPQKNKVNGKE